MSYDSAQNIELDGIFRGGYADNTPEHSLKDQYSPYLRNARLDGKSIESRPGHSLLSTLTAGDYPRGIGSYLRTSSSNDRLVVRHNTDSTHKLYTIETDGTATSILTDSNITSDNRMEFTNIDDVVYCMNGVDDFGKLSNTTYTTPSTGITNFSPSFSVVFNSSHWASGWSDNANKVYKSVGDNYEDFNSTGSDSFTFEETITSLVKNNQALFYFTKNTISVTGVDDIQEIGGAINYTTRGLTAKEGAINHASTVSSGNNIYTLTPSNKIIQVARGQSVDGFEVIELSERDSRGISKIMQTLDSDQSDSFGYFLPKENLIKWHLKSNGSTFNDVCIIYDIIHDAFLVDDNKFFYAGVAFKGLNYTISMIEPKVYIDEYGYDDEDSPISFRYETKNFDLGVPQTKKELWECNSYIAINNLAEMTKQIIIDGNTVYNKTIDSDNIPISTGGIATAPIGTFPVGTGGGFTGDDSLSYVTIRATKGDLQYKGYKIKVIYTQNAIAGRVRLENLSMRVEILPMEANNLTV